jgi:hypothetical protein
MIDEQKSEAAKMLGRSGGNKTLELYGKEHYRLAAQKAVEARKANKKAKEAGDNQPLDK